MRASLLDRQLQSISSKLSATYPLNKFLQLQVKDLKNSKNRKQNKNRKIQFKTCFLQVKRANLFQDWPVKIK